MKKNVPIIIGIVVGVVVIFLVIIVLQRKFAKVSYAVQYRGDKIVLQTTDGQQVEINDIYQNPIQQFDKNSILFEATNDYRMSFYPQDNGFIITLTNQQIQRVRTIAESTFVERLGITKQQACLLKVSLVVPFSVNANAAGVNYGLSFCSQGKPLPR